MTESDDRTSTGRSRMFRCRPPYGMTEAYKFSNARQARASESNLRILFSTLPPFRFTTASVAAHARSPLLAQRAAARSCRPSGRIAHSSAASTCSACPPASAVCAGDCHRV
eukprot:scaffold483_cov107-Isochrysis_galbana.AAC.11